MIVSTFSLSLSIPARAFLIRGLPSNLNGVVTTPTVRAPCFLAIDATTGAAPVPVPPPIPQVTNTMSAPSSAFAISSALSSAALSPTSLLAPAPSPLVVLAPIGIVTPALHFLISWISVLIPISSALVIPDSTILDTALLPHPPIPTTFILATCSFSLLLSSNKVLTLLQYHIHLTIIN